MHILTSTWCVQQDKGELSAAQPMSFSGKGQNNDIRPDSFLLAPAVQYCLFSVLAVTLQSGPFTLAPVP